MLQSICGDVCPPRSYLLRRWSHLSSQNPWHSSSRFANNWTNVETFKAELDIIGDGKVFGIIRPQKTIADVYAPSPSLSPRQTTNLWTRDHPFFITLVLHKFHKNQEMFADCSFQSRLMLTAFLSVWIVCNISITIIHMHIKTMFVCVCAYWNINP